METVEVAERINKMWLTLAEEFEGAVLEIVTDGRPIDAIRWATYAEACFWKATGDADTHDVKDILEPPADRAANKGA